MAINDVTGERKRLYHVWDILREFLCDNFVPVLRTLKLENLKKTRNLKPENFFIKNPDFFQPCLTAVGLLRIQQDRPLCPSPTANVLLIDFWRHPQRSDARRARSWDYLMPYSLFVLTGQIMGQVTRQVTRSMSGHWITVRIVLLAAMKP